MEPRGSKDLVDSTAFALQSVRGQTFVFDSGLWRWNDSEWESLFDQKIFSLTEDTVALFAALEAAGVVRSFDTGVTWERSNNGLPLDSGGIVSVLAERGIVLAFTGQGSVYVSNNEGDSWQWRSRTLGAWPVVFASNKIYGTNEGEGKISLSHDNGTSWDSIAMPEAYNRQIVGLWPYSSGIAFSRYDGVYVANETPSLIFRDSVQGWAATGFASDDSLVYIAERLGDIYAEPLSSLPLAVSPVPTQIAGATLHIFPNPSNGLGTFSFTIPKVENVSLKLFDETGVNVATYYNGFAGPGETQVPFDATKLASGVYIGVLSTPEGSATARIVVLPR